MMNLDLLFEAGDLTGIERYYDIAAIHAETTAAHHLRSDGGYFERLGAYCINLEEISATSYHVVNYNEGTGAVTSRYTAQGYKDWSTWSRGQAWGLYGFGSSTHFFRNKITQFAESLLSSLPAHEMAALLGHCPKNGKKVA
jgi:unsaturated chondroitin disaccharide hydrolase